MHIFVVQTKPRHVVDWHLRSVVVSALFLVNLALMPFVYYVSDPIVVSEAYTIPWKVLANDSTATAAMRDHVTQLLGPTAYSSNQGMVAFRAVYPLASASTNSCSLPAVSDLPGSIFYPSRVRDNLTGAMCALSPFHAAWNIHYMGFPVSMSMVWTTIEDGATTVYYIFSPINLSISWCVAMLFCRFAMSGYIVRRTWLDYYVHVQRLQSSSRDMTAVVVGEPTSLILANKWVILAFVADLTIHPTGMGAATVRLLYAKDAWAFCQGVVYFSRFVWFSYAAIWLGNEWTLRLPSISTSACAWTVTIVNLVLVRSIGAMNVAYVIFSSAFNLIDADATLDVTICTVASYGLYFVLPFAMAFVADIAGSWHRKAATKPSASPSMPVSTQTSREWKQWILWRLYGFGRGPCSKPSAVGPLDRLLEVDQTYQRHPMLRQDCTDCFILDKTTGTMHQLCLASRIRWPDRVAPIKDDQKSGVEAVSRLRVASMGGMHTEEPLASWVSLQ
ncbi:hypothetical protein AeNC1_009526 [Aphanomyces euteiches]|nr:hypothetical protein AeNC1_009526 [Aphanomyces euteiches]